MAKILVAEDEPDIRNLIAFILQYHNHEAITARNGDEALALARSEPFDLILLDIRMPNITGYDVCRAIKADNATANIPVVFITAKGQESEIEEGYKAGASLYIMKPFDPPFFLQCVENLLANTKEEKILLDKTLFSPTGNDPDLLDPLIDEKDHSDERPDDQ